MASDRSKKVRTADIPQRIVEQATRLFAARGFVGASLRDIAETVGIRKPSLLYHFSSKDELRQRVLEDMLGRWNEVLPRLLVAATSGTEQFDAVVKECVDFFRQDPDRARLLLRETLDNPDEMRERLQTQVLPWSQIVANYIRQGQAAGRVHADVDPEAYVFNMINLLVSSVATHPGLATVITGDDTPLESALDRHLKEMFRIAKSSLFVSNATVSSATASKSQPKADAAPKALGSDDKSAAQ